MTKLRHSLLAGLFAGLIGTASLAAAVKSIEPAESQNWKFVHSPEMTFQSDFNAEGLAIQLTGVAGSPNYTLSSVEVDWESAAKGKIEIALRAEQARGVYFAVELVTTDGKTYRAVASGDPKKGYPLSHDWAVAEIPLSMFLDNDGQRLEPGQPIARAGMIFAVEPEISNTIYIQKISLDAE